MDDIRIKMYSKNFSGRVSCILQILWVLEKSLKFNIQFMHKSFLYQYIYFYRTTLLLSCPATLEFYDAITLTKHTTVYLLHCGLNNINLSYLPWAWIKIYCKFKRNMLNLRFSWITSLQLIVQSQWLLSISQKIKFSKKKIIFITSLNTINFFFILFF